MTRIFDITSFDVMIIKADIAAWLLNDGCRSHEVWDSHLSRSPPFTESIVRYRVRMKSLDYDLDEKIGRSVRGSFAYYEEAHGRPFVCLTERIDYILSSPQYWRTTHVTMNTHRLVC